MLTLNLRNFTVRCIVLALPFVFFATVALAQSTRTP